MYRYRFPSDQIFLILFLDQFDDFKTIGLLRSVTFNNIGGAMAILRYILILICFPEANREGVSSDRGEGQ